MKKIIAVVMAVAVMATLGIVAFAEATSDPVDDGTPDEPLPPSDEESAEEKTEDTVGINLDEALSKLMSAPFWATVTTVLASLVGCIALFKNKLAAITSSIGKTATTEHLTKQTGSLAKEIKKELGEKTERISNDITAMMDNYKLMLTCFTIFIESAKINANAKKEILDRLTGVKGVSDSVAETVAEALKAIEEANAAEPVVETPKTDAALAETPAMLLG